LSTVPQSDFRDLSTDRTYTPTYVNPSVAYPQTDRKYIAPPRPGNIQNYPLTDKKYSPSP
jgi:hypothetical protein